MSVKLPSLPVLKPRERLLAAASGVVIVLWLLDAFVLHPWLRHGQMIRQEIRDLERSLADHRQLLSRKRAVFAQEAQYVEFLRPSLTDELQMAALLKEVEGLAERSQVELGEIKPLGAQADALTKQYSLDVRFGCTLESWIQFIVAVEASPSLFQISRAEVALNEEEPDQLDASLRLVSVVLQQPSFLKPETADVHATSAVR
jgi:hypothetical protein